MKTDLIESALSDNRCEVARRLCLKELAFHSTSNQHRNQILLQLHLAYRYLGEYLEAEQTLNELLRSGYDNKFEVTMRRAEDAKHFTNYDFYRISEESKKGYTWDQYEEKMSCRSRELARQAKAFAMDLVQRERLGLFLQNVGLTNEAREFLTAETKSATKKDSAEEFGSLAGVIRFPDGKKAENIKVTLGLKSEVMTLDPLKDLTSDMDWRPDIKPLKSLITTTDSDGQFLFESVPAAIHDFLAVTLDAEKYEFATRFLAQSIHVEKGKKNQIELTIDEWKSAPARVISNPFPDTLKRQGVIWKRVHVEVLQNPFYYNFPRQLIKFQLPEGVASEPGEFLLLDSTQRDLPIDFQVAAGEVLIFSDLPILTDRIFGFYKTSGVVSVERLPNLFPKLEPDGKTAVIDTGSASFRIPYSAGSDDLPPLISVRGFENVWRGHGRFTFPQGIFIRYRKTEVVESGPLELKVRTDYELSNGTSYSWVITTHRGEATLLVDEYSPEVEGAAFEFSLKEFQGGRGYLHWKVEGGDRHWSDLLSENRELARLQESVAWWLPGQGFAYAMSPDGSLQNDYIGVFTRKRGEWVDRKFEKLAQGPGENRELDWPHPEMVGSTISMITAHTTVLGDCYYRFGFFEGERHWGILLSTVERNDGPWKELSQVQHKNSSPTLQDFKGWNLDCPDLHERPFMTLKKSRIPHLRHKKNSPVFAKYWQKILNGESYYGPTSGIYFLVENDPLVAWKRKLEIIEIAKMRSKMVLLGRDFGDTYSPVGARAITPLAEDYDLIVGSGVFTQEEERIVREFFVLMGHMHMERDLMNWFYNSRNANFESDRVDVVGTVGICFRDNPDSQKFIQHTTDLMGKSLEVYCTPGSGRWYENVGCYYIHASKCRMNIAYHLYRSGLYDVTKIPRLKDFLNWGIEVLMPPTPLEYRIMRDGPCGDDYSSVDKARRIPPIGDHAHVGHLVPDHYAFIAKIYRKSDPMFADRLLAAFQAGGADGGFYRNCALFIASLEEEDLKPVPLQPLASRRLEGFGAVFRDHFDTNDEFYLLLKQGPSGYRYHRTEGSFILFFAGRPLIYEGGEAGDTWRHSTLSFYDVGMPLAPGHVERFHDFTELGFVQGVHPTAIKPGEPICLNDDCHHSLVKVAYERFAEPNPVDVRSVFVVRDEYVIVHDDLLLDPSIPCKWHLQAVADSHTKSENGEFIFSGRFGVDLQVALPGQKFAEESVEPLPIVDIKYNQNNEVEGYRFLRPPRSQTSLPLESFATQHLMVRSETPDHYLAILRPLDGRHETIQSSPLIENGKTVGVSIRGKGIEDYHIFSRTPISLEQFGISIEGRYASVINRAGVNSYYLLSGSRIKTSDIELRSSSSAVMARITQKQAVITAEGQGKVELFLKSRHYELDIKEKKTTIVYDL
jgi:hypothetical protein